VVILILLTLVLEAGIANVPDYFLNEDKGRFDFRNGNPEPVVCPVNYLNLIFWPKYLQWVDDPGLYLEAVRQGVVLYHADEAVLGENPHSGHPLTIVLLPITGWSSIREIKCPPVPVEAFLHPYHISTSAVASSRVVLLAHSSHLHANELFLGLFFRRLLVGCDHRVGV